LSLFLNDFSEQSKYKEHIKTNESGQLQNWPLSFVFIISSRFASGIIQLTNITALRL